MSEQGEGNQVGERRGDMEEEVIRSERSMSGHWRVHSTRGHGSSGTHDNGVRYGGMYVSPTGSHDGFREGGPPTGRGESNSWRGLTHTPCRP